MAKYSSSSCASIFFFSPNFGPKMLILLVCFVYASLIFGACGLSCAVGYFAETSSGTCQLCSAGSYSVGGADPICSLSPIGILWRPFLLSFIIFYTFTLVYAPGYYVPSSGSSSFLVCASATFAGARSCNPYYPLAIGCCAQIYCMFASLG